jgi:hypothetical protein
MLYTSILRAIAPALLLIGAHGRVTRRQTSLDQFVKSEADVSIKGVFANIGPDGSKAQGAAAGAVVASPSRTDPDCKYMSYLIQYVSNLTYHRLVHVDPRLSFDVQDAGGAFRCRRHVSEAED